MDAPRPVWSSRDRRPIPVTADGAYIVDIIARILARAERDRSKTA